jgi:hypothetical protein
MRNLVLRWSAAVCLVATVAVAEDNPSAEGFNSAGSDPRAIEIADAVMERMGGRHSWNSTECISWTIFGRSHVWNRHTADYRMETDTSVVIMNLNSGTGRSWERGVPLDGEENEVAIQRAHSVWINDSYWLVMPYKLKDTGVTLYYRGEAATEDGRAAEVLELTFSDVGETPDNKYEVYVDRESGLVSQWAFYRNTGDPEPRFVLPWSDWTRYGDIQLSSGRGKFDVTEISVTHCAGTGAFDKP